MSLTHSSFDAFSIMSRKLACYSSTVCAPPQSEQSKQPFALILGRVGLKTSKRAQKGSKLWELRPHLIPPVQKFSWPRSICSPWTPLAWGACLRAHNMLWLIIGSDQYLVASAGRVTAHLQYHGQTITCINNPLASQPRPSPGLRRTVTWPANISTGWSTAPGISLHCWPYLAFQHVSHHYAISIWQKDTSPSHTNRGHLGFRLDACQRTSPIKLQNR